MSTSVNKSDKKSVFSREESTVHPVVIVIDCLDSTVIGQLMFFSGTLVTRGVRSHCSRRSPRHLVANCKILFTILNKYAAAEDQRKADFATRVSLDQSDSPIAISSRLKEFRIRFNEQCVVS